MPSTPAESGPTPNEAPLGKCSYSLHPLIRCRLSNLSAWFWRQMVRCCPGWVPRRIADRMTAGTSLEIILAGQGDGYWVIDNSRLEDYHGQQAPAIVHQTWTESEARLFILRTVVLGRSPS